MREIKFRAWVKYTTDHAWEWAYKKAEEVLSVNQDVNATEIRSKYLHEWESSHNQEERYSVKEYMTNLDEVSVSCSGRITTRINVEVIHLMQFTGLKDKNGKEIYEGDIVSWGGSMYGFGKVVYERYSFLVKYKLGEVEDEMYFNHPDAYTIIGNIYENPELKP